MPIFHYRARDRRGNTREGEIEAPDPSAAAAELRRREMWPTSIEEAAGPQPERWQQGPWTILNPPSPGELGRFLAQLASLLNSGVNAHEAMSDVAERTADRRLQRAAAEMAQGLAAGAAMADQMARYPNLFPPHVIGSVEAGESFGGLPEVLGALAGQLATEATLQARLRWLRLYYGVVLGLAVLVAPFPLMVARGMRWYLMLEATRVLPAAAGLIILLVFARVASGRRGAALWSRLVIRIPVFGSLARWSALVRFLTAMQLSQRAGATLDRGLVAGGQATGHAHIAAAAERAAQLVQAGRGLGEALPETGLLPPRIINMLAVAERAGTIEDALDNAAQWAEERRSASVNIITTGTAAGGLAVAAVATLIALALAYTNLYRAVFERAGIEW